MLSQAHLELAINPVYVVLGIVRTTDPILKRVKGPALLMVDIKKQTFAVNPLLLFSIQSFRNRYLSYDLSWQSYAGKVNQEEKLRNSDIKKT